jgi:CelD/BcsL family acetyltransferase involved in cellulose biosynthesis
LGIAPFFLADNREGERALLLLGSIEISDYLDLIVSAEHLTDFIEGLFDYIFLPQQTAWQVLDFYNLLENSPTRAVLRKSAQKRGWMYYEEPLQNCPYIPLSTDWETYLAGLDKKQRHEIRRKLRRADQSTPPVSWYFVDDVNVLDQVMDSLFQLMAFDPEKKAFLTELMQKQMKATAHAAFNAGWLKLAFITVGNEKAAAYFTFDFQKRIWVYNSGFDPSFRELSPGWVLLSRLLQWSIENQRHSFDFLRGEEDYKYRFGAVNRRVFRARITC